MHEARATDAVDHLQAAALELIEAARAFLDVLEELIGDRERFDDAVAAVGTVAGAAVRAAGLVAQEDAPPAERAEPPVERIPVS